MNLKMRIKKIIVALIGVTILGFGLGIAAMMDMGSDPMASFSYGLASLFNMEYSRINTIISIIMVVIAFILWPKTIGVATLMSALLVQFPIDFIYQYVNKTDNIFINIMLFLLATFLTALGAELVIMSKLGMSTYEAFTFAFVYRFKIRFLTVKYICDALFLLAAILLHATIGIGTIISYCLTGILMSKIEHLVEPILNIKE